MQTRVGDPQEQVDVPGLCCRRRGCRTGTKVGRKLEEELKQVLVEGGGGYM